MTVAREITRALRHLYPAPIRLSVRDVSLPGSVPEFLVRLPARPASDLSGSGRYGLVSYLERQLSSSTRPVAVRVAASRTIRRRDCGRDVEFTIQIGGISWPPGTRSARPGLTGPAPGRTPSGPSERPGKRPRRTRWPPGCAGTRRS